MIFGVGMDMIEIPRIAKLLERHRDLTRIFGPEELQMLRRKASVPSYAANFCAKEAFAKALGTGVRGFSLPEVQLLRDEAGRPYYRLSGAAAETVHRLGLRFHVSVTHTSGHACVCAVAEKEENR